MNWKKMTLTALLTLGLLAIPALAQDASTTSSGQATPPDHNDTNAKTKKAGQKTEDTSVHEKMTGAKNKTKIDINSASKDELAGLPGMDKSTAQKVIDGRPYTKKSQLVSKKVLSQDEYGAIENQVIAKKSKTSSSDTTGATSTKGKSAKKSTDSTTAPPQ